MDYCASFQLFINKTIQYSFLKKKKKSLTFSTLCLLDLYEIFVMKYIFFHHGVDMSQFIPSTVDGIVVVPS